VLHYRGIIGHTYGDDLLEMGPLADDLDVQACRSLASEMRTGFPPLPENMLNKKAPPPKLGGALFM